MLSGLNLVRATGLIWPANQLLPAFSTPTPVLDSIDISSASSAEIDLFTSLEGIVNRTQPRVVCVSTVNGEGEFTWLNLHNLSTNPITGYNAILKYQTNFTGLVVTDPNQPDTLNLATTMAGVNNELICNPSLLPTLTNSPYNLPITDDLRGRFANKYGVYGYLYTNYWPQCSHRILAGLETNLDGNLRDYLVATKTATVWLDPGSVSQDAAMMSLFTSQMTPANSVYIGWVPNEGNDVPWLATYGIPVVASDFFVNGSVFSGVTSPINIPAIPPPPPLQNKVYVALLLSDGDNAQYMQHAMKINWENASRGSVPIGWTVDALAANLDPVMLNYYWSTATTNDCLISGPSGAGYGRMEHWSGANLAAFANIADGYLQRSGLRVITVWDSVNSGIAQAYATNCPSLLGLTDQNGTYNAVNLGLRTIAETPTYASTVAQMTNAIVSAAASWNGTAPVFVVAQADAWNLVPSDLLNIAKVFATNEYVFVRPDQLFMLANQVYGTPLAVTQPPAGIAAGSATLQGVVIPKAANAGAWLEWGTNTSYGSRSAMASVAGNSLVPVSATVAGLVPGTIYHYRAAVSNAVGMAWGADKMFNLGGRLKAWGDDSLGQTNVPAGLTNVFAISCGAYHGLALKNDGTVTAWGYDSYNQTNVPTGLANVVEVAGGVQHSLALQSNGLVAAWGDNSYGQTDVPAGLSNVVAIAAGGYHNLALKNNGTVTAWGYNLYGQTNVPAGLSNTVAVAAGKYHSLALKSDGTVTVWGNNNYGQTNAPAGLNQVVAISAGDYHSLALKANGIASPGLLPACRWVADSLTGTSGTPVSSWNDSVQGKSATQNSTGSQPQLYTNAFAGHNVVRFASAGSQYLTVAAVDSSISGAGDFTMVVVFRTSTPGNASSSFYLNTGLLGADLPGAAADWSLVINGSQLGAGLGDGAGGCSSDFSLYGGNVTDGSPHIGMYVRAGNTIRLYVDGVIVAEQTSLCTAARSSEPFEIGAMTTAPYFFNGDIAEIQLYTRALNSFEIVSDDNALANAYGMSGIAGVPRCRWVADNLPGASGSSVSNWTDNLGGKNATQPSAGNQPKVYSNVLNGHKTVRFSGSSQYLTVAAVDSPISAAGSFTMEVVFRTSTPGNASSSFYLNTGLLGADLPGVVHDWSFVINGSQLGAGLGAGANECGSDFSLYGGNVTDGYPHIGMYVRAGDTITLYVDGAVVASQNTLCADARVDCPFEIGAMTTAPYYFNGDIAEIQLYNRALNPLEVMNDNEQLAATFGIGGGVALNVVVWGNNASGQTNVPAGLTNVLAVASGSAFNLALQAGGTVTGWGNNGQGQLTLPSGLTNVVAIAGGTNFTLAIADEIPQAISTNVAGYVNHDLAFALPATSPDGLPLNFHLLSLPASGALYQYSAGGRGLPISAPNTLVSDPNGQLIFAPAPGGTGNPYAVFSFMVDDGTYSSGQAQMTVNIVLPAAPQFTGFAWNPASSAAGSFELNFSGSTNAAYTVWATTNLLNWVNLGTATESSPGQFQFIDQTVPDWSQKFYRLSAP
ncbi:MAG TPA: LamG-like jellyroll fold domain-containing protein [Candidatus Sulfotelmatobacter sp.]|nr:LamG-like jellyroll fold domain-containing protein [Candidatus Sulfotelmatobacter sp.]